jgi:hypothetical protein
MVAWLMAVAGMVAEECHAASQKSPEAFERDAAAAAACVPEVRITRAAAVGACYAFWVVLDHDLPMDRSACWIAGTFLELEAVAAVAGSAALEEVEEQVAVAPEESLGVLALVRAPVLVQVLEFLVFLRLIYLGGHQLVLFGRCVSSLLVLRTGGGLPFLRSFILVSHQASHRPPWHSAGRRRHPPSSYPSSSATRLAQTPTQSA